MDGSAYYLQRPRNFLIWNYGLKLTWVYDLFTFHMSSIRHYVACETTEKYGSSERLGSRFSTSITDAKA
jgi:hypothetical protein